ncbi:MAG: hypothetical protein KDD25_08200 [Bdellovibrionales bacterium]|nr:hypothetical protein [Bdellovibrionales bacterium]
MKNQKGQGLVEYLIIVALIAVASIAVTKVLGQNIQGQLARITNAISSKPGKPRLNPIREGHYKQKDLSNFFDGASTDNGEE